MDWGTLLIALIGAIGGGLGVAIVTSIANRHKVKADVVKTTAEAEAVDQGAINSAYESLAKTAETLMSVAEKRIANLCERVEALEKKADAREDTIEEQQKEIIELRDTVNRLTLENAKLRTENINLTRRLRDVETKLRGLTGMVDHDGSES